MDDLADRAVERQREETAAGTRPPAELETIVPAPGDAVALCRLGDIAATEDGHVTEVASEACVVIGERYALDLGEVR